MGSCSRAAALLLGGLACAAPALADSLYLYEVPVHATGRLPDASSPLRVKLHVRRPERLAAQLGGAAVVRDGAVELALGRSDTLPGQPEARHRAASFVIDWNEKDVTALHAELVAAHGPAPSLEVLREFTARSIPRKTLEQGWDFASAVARKHSGDCTEHAVLLAALARSVGRPARVVAGVVFALQDGAIAGYGHAWTEIHDGEAWRRVDATPIGEEASVRYLPLFALEDEGPGYSMALAATTQAVWVREIEVSGSR